MSSMAPVPHVFARLQRLAVRTALIIVAGVTAIAYGPTLADAAKVAVLGAGPPQKPSCPNVDDACFVEARVTGFQTSIGATRKPFVARFPGRVVAWSIKLGRPSSKDNRCFSNGCTVGNDEFPGFGGPARARLAILKPIRKKIKAGQPVYELKRQSPVENLAPFFGTTTTFTLQKPLPIGKGNIAALTITTWAPVFVGGLSSSYGWRASRNPTKKRGGCTIGTGANQSANIRAGSPQQAVGKTRRYACAYRTNRLLYSATMVKRPSG
jgi:hypothetical protein